jgi:hypothetical protein
MSNIQSTSNGHSVVDFVPKRSVSGPLHICCHLNLWAISVCFLMALVLWNTPLCSLMPGSVFSRDFRCIFIATFLWG